MHLDFSNRGIRVFDAAALDLGAEGTQMVRSLDLSGNLLEAVFNLGTVFKAVKTLNLSGNRLGDFFSVGEHGGAVERRRLLPTSLEKLDLSNCELESIGALVDSLPNVHHLILSSNSSLQLDFRVAPATAAETPKWGGRGGPPLPSSARGHIAKAPAALPRLTHIDLNGCSLQSTEALSPLRSLVKVSLRANPLASVEDVLVGLAPLPFLRHVILDGAPVAEAHWGQLVKALNQNVQRLTSINGLPVSQSARGPPPSPVYDFAATQPSFPQDASVTVRATRGIPSTSAPSYIQLARVAELEKILKEVLEEEGELRRGTGQQGRSLQRLQGVETQQHVAIEALAQTKAELEAAVVATNAAIAKCDADFAKIHDRMQLQKVGELDLELDV